VNQVLLGLGSNIDPAKHLPSAAQRLRQMFQQVQFSAVYRSQAVGIDGGADFLNACCVFHCQQNHDTLRQQLKQLEEAHGRVRAQKGWQSRTLDLDIILFNEQVMDQDLYQYSHVWVPACELLSLQGDTPTMPILYPSSITL